MESQASSIAIKPVAFNPPEARAWFRIMDAQFALANITVSTTKFNHALAALPASLVMNLDDDTIAAMDYEKLKAEVLEQTLPTKSELFDDFLQANPLLTGKPSQHLRSIKKLATQVGVSEDLVRHRFQKSLPNNLAVVLATQKTLPLEELGRLADELVALTPGVQHSQTVHDSTMDVTAVKRPTNKSTALEPFTPGQRPKVCRAHLYYGPEARSCRSWCMWPDKGGVKVARSRNASPASRQTKSENQ